MEPGLILIVPLVTAALCYLLGRPGLTGYVSLAGSIALAGASIPSVSRAVASPFWALNGIIYMDALSGYMMALVVLLALASAAYSIEYMEHELREGITDRKGVARYYALLHLFVFTMLLVIVSDNLALMWIAIEATTIVSALLIGLGYYKRRLAIEAAWKYIILCTVGITFALLGVFIVYYASIAVIGTGGALEWTELRKIAGSLNPSTMKLAFIFILIGYGTKAGLAPLHNWLPDAHSQAPSPISALLSGILLNTSFYGIMRFVYIVNPSVGDGFTGGLLILFGLTSMLVSSVFILVQDSYKRLLAYSSIEHMGIIAIGVGVGGKAGLYGALLHILNHALAKPLMFFASGRIQAGYGSTRMEDVRGVLLSRPLLGGITLIGALALAGTPPFNIFISELTVLSAAVKGGMWVVSGIFLISVVTVFYGMLSGFGSMLFAAEGSAVGHKPASASGRGAADRPVTSFPEALLNAVMIAMAVMIVILGFRVPGIVDRAITACLIHLGVS